MTRFAAADFRRAKLDATAASPAISGVGFLSFSSSYDKVQYAPDFGMELLSTTLHGANGSGAAGFPQTSIISSTKYQASADEFVLITRGLNAAQADGLTLALREVGVSIVRTFPFATLRASDAGKRSPRDAASVDDISAALLSTS